MINSIKADIYFRMGQSKAEKGYFEESISFFDRAISLSKAPFGIFLHKALSLANLKHYEESVNLLKKSIDLTPGNPCNYLFLGVVHYDNHSLDDAMHCFKKVIELSPENKLAECYKYLTCIAKNEKDLEAHDSLIKNIQNSNAECKARYLLLCESFLQLHKKDSMTFEEKHFFETYLDPDRKKGKQDLDNSLTKIETTINRLRYFFLPKYRKLYKQLLLSNKYLTSGNIDKAQEEIQLILDSEPHFDEALEALIDICIYKNEIELAIKYLNKIDSFQEALKLLDPEKNVKDTQFTNSSIALILSVLYMHKGEYENAIKLLEKCISENDKNFYPFYCLGRCYLYSNDNRQAFNYFKMSMNRLTHGLLIARSDEYKRVLGA